MVGIDIIKISRLEEAIKKSSSFKTRVFTTSELEYYQSKGNKAQTLAGIWAAKEAFIKAFGKPLDCIDIEVGHNDLGKPYITCKKSNIFKADLSISHDGDYAVAVVMVT